MNDQEIRQFIVETGAKTQRITEQVKRQLIDQLVASGFRDVVLSPSAFFSAWELEMTHGRNPPAINAEVVERSLRDPVGRLGWAIKHDLIVTVALGGRVKSRFFLSPAGEAGAA